LDARLPSSRKNIKRSKRENPDRHGWNTLENYKQIHYDRLTNHSFVDQSKPIPDFEPFYDGEILFIALEGEIYCKHNVVLSLTKLFETRIIGDGRLQVRCFSYRYNASILGKHNILRYDNNHDFDDYHKHEFDMQTGHQIKRTSLQRNDFPVMSEVLDEIEGMFN
jgi:hypothetical protein